MKHFKRALAVLLTLCLTAGLVPAALAAESFPAVNAYAGFPDVAEGDWFYSSVKRCYETGLMNGTDNGFEPNTTLPISQCAVVAARIRETLTGETIPMPAAGEVSWPWYAPYLYYLEDVIQSNSALSYAKGPLATPEYPATRQDFIDLLGVATDLVADKTLYPALNSITALPDTDDSLVLAFYNVGVLTGVDKYGTFDADGTLTRAECAAMVARVTDAALRQRFTPQVKEETPSLSYEEELMQTEALRINGISVTFQTFLDTLNPLIFRTDYSLAANSGQRLDWDAQYQGIDDLEAYFIDQAIGQVVEDTLIATRAAALGCSVDDLPARLTPDPAKDLNKIYRAKHILVADEQTANALLAALMQNPSTAYFDQLLAQYGTDPGMTSNPDGYLFTDGDMVTEFENAVKALDIGACSSVPVQSSFGYHIILRLDPTGLAGWQQQYQAMKYEDYVTDWVNSATVTPNNVELGKLDVRGRYADYLASLGG